MWPHSDNAKAAGSQLSSPRLCVDKEEALKSATNRIALGGRRVAPLAFVVPCVLALALVVLSAPAHASQVNGPEMSSMTTPSLTSIPDSEALARSAATPFYVMFKNSLTSYCLSTNWTFTPYTVPCNPAADGQWWDISGTTIRNYLTGKCLSTNWTYSVYTATCGSGAVAHNWTIWPNGQVQNWLTYYCLSTNWTYEEYTAGCNSAARGQLWMLL
jgi:hypothetical protein